MAANVMGSVTEASGRIQLIKFPNAPSPGLYPFPLEDFAALQIFVISCQCRCLTLSLDVLLIEVNAGALTKKKLTSLLCLEMTTSHLRDTMV
jgi:hypothetical protein